MFIEAIDPLWLGAGFTARLTLDRPVKLNCFVKRVEPGHGMGVSVGRFRVRKPEGFRGPAFRALQTPALDPV